MEESNNNQEQHDKIFKDFIHSIFGKDVTIVSSSKALEKPKYDIGECFVLNDHYYQQRANDVLHVSSETDSSSIDSLSIDTLNYHTELQKINKIEFKLAVQKVIYEMDINSFWSNN